MGVRTVWPGEKGVDFSYTKPPPQRLVELGYTFVVGYLSYTGTKNLLNPQAYLDAGLAVMYVWEVNATRTNAGYTVGRADGAEARRQATVLGYPQELAIIAANDTNTTSANVSAQKQYMVGFKETCGAMGQYDDTDLAGVTVGLWEIGWLPNAWGWSGLSKAQALVKAKAIGFHVYQSTGFYIDNKYPVDPNTVDRPFSAWSNIGDEMRKITNSEARLHTDGNTYPPGVIKWVYGESGKRHIKSEEESTTLFPDAGVPLSNAALDAIPDVAVATGVPTIKFPNYTVTTTSTSTATPQ